MSAVEGVSVSSNLWTNDEPTQDRNQGLTTGELYEETVHQHDFEASEEDHAERIVAYQVLDSFHKYRSMAHRTIHRRRQNLYALPSSQWRQLAGPPFYLLDTLSNVDDAIDANGRLADAIVDVTTSSMNFPHDPSSTEKMPWDGFAKINDHNKAQSTLRQFYRDWTTEGYQTEVKPLLDIIVSDLAKYSPPSNTPTDTSNMISANILNSHILLPGAGLSRLLLELVLRGHNVTGNEISYHQLMASNFILNHNTTGPNSHIIYPWATSFCNTISRTHQLRAYTIPDIDASTAVTEARERGNAVGEMGMAAGDFCTSFNGQDSAEEYSAVVTAYFIDTAPNLFRYIQTVYNCLQADGLWINVGPLLWHFDARERSSTKDDCEEEQEQVTDENDKDDDDDDDEEQQDHREKAKGRPSAQNDGQTYPSNTQRKRMNKGVVEEEDAGIAEPGSFELTHDEVLLLVAQSGFEILFQEILPDGMSTRNGNTAAAGGGGGVEGCSGIYLQDPHSMMQMRYRCGHWVARKKKKENAGQQ